MRYAEAKYLEDAADLADTAQEAAAAPADEVVRVHEALAELEALDARLAQVVEMRYFAGFDDRQIAAALGVTDRTVRRQWDKARLLLGQALEG